MLGSACMFRICILSSVGRVLSSVGLRPAA